MSGLSADSLVDEFCDYCDEMGIEAFGKEALAEWLVDHWLPKARAAERREGQRDGWDEGEKAGREAERARWKRLTDDRIERPPMLLPNPYRDNQTGATR